MIEKPTKFDPEQLLKNLVERLLGARCEPASPGREHDAGYDESNLAAGQEDLTTGYADLGGILDGIASGEKRRAAYLALLRVANGVERITKSTAYPLGEERHSQEAQARVAQWVKDQKLAVRDKIVMDVVAEQEVDGKIPKAQILIDLVTRRLAEAYDGKPPKMSLGMLYAIIRKWRSA